MDDQTFQPRQQFQNTLTPKGPGKNTKRIVLVIIVILIFAGGAFGINQLLGNKGASVDQTLMASPSPTEFIMPTDIPSPTSAVSLTPSPSADPSVTASPTPKSTTSPIDKASGLDRSKLTIEIQNGNGQAGVGKTAADFLANLGYKISATGNADNFDYEETTISVVAGKSGYLTLLKKDLGSNYTIGSTSANLTSTTSDAVIIIGK